MDNKAYEKHRAENPTQNHTVKEPDAFDPFDGHHTNTEIGIVVVMGLLVIYALWQIVRPKSKKE
jgi:hypothetical protein